MWINVRDWARRMTHIFRSGGAAMYEGKTCLRDVLLQTTSALGWNLTLAKTKWVGVACTHYIDTDMELSRNHRGSRWSEWVKTTLGLVFGLSMIIQVFGAVTSIQREPHDDFSGQLNSLTDQFGEWPGPSSHHQLSSGSGSLHERKWNDENLFASRVRGTCCTCMYLHEYLKELVTGEPPSAIAKEKTCCALG